jgi:hypothetical protein
MQRAGSARIPNIAWYPELRAFEDEGWSREWIAEAVRLSPRQVRRVFAEGQARNVAAWEIPIKQFVKPEDLALLEWTPEAFAAFFSRFSGYSLPPHALEWISLFIAHPNLILHVPPNHSKTTIMAIWLTVWLICRDRNTQVLIVSQTLDLAQNTARSIAQILTDPDITQAFGRFVPTPADEEPWKVEQGKLMVLGRTKKAKPGDLTVMSRGMGQSVLGFRADVVIGDDITNAEIALSPTEHAKELAKFKGEILTRIDTENSLDAAGRALIIGQRVAFNDLYADLHELRYTYGEKAGQLLWHVEVQKALPEGWEGPALWESWMPKSRLARLHAELGTALFDTMYQQEPVAEGDLVFRPEWIDGCRSDRPGGVGYNGPYPKVRTASVDPSPSMFNAAVIADVVTLPGGDIQYVLLAIEEWQGGTRQFRERITRWMSEYRITHLIVEESSFFKWIADDEWFQELQEYLTIVRHRTQQNKNDQAVGVDSLAADFEFRRISLPCGDETGRKMTGILTRQLKVYPFTKVFDAIMALWFLKWNRKKLKHKKRRSGIIPGHGAGRPNAAGRKMLADREAKRRLGKTSVMELERTG